MFELMLIVMDEPTCEANSQKLEKEKAEVQNKKFNHSCKK